MFQNSNFVCLKMKLIQFRVTGITNKMSLKIWHACLRRTFLYREGCRKLSTSSCRKLSTSPCLHKVKDQQIDISKIRNIGIMAHIDAGKTTTTERMLYYSGFTRRLGDVDDGDTVMDYMDQERDRGITITSAAITFHWGENKINLIDTPGHVDFTVEVDRSLRVLDGAVAILDASAGVEAQTLTVWRQADNYDIPRLAFLNKMDKPGASLDVCVRSIQDKLHVTPLVLNIPVGSGGSFHGVIDVVAMEKLTWDGSSRDGSSFKREAVDIYDGSEDAERTLKARTDLIGLLADYDEVIADLVLCDTDLGEFPEADLISAVRTVTLQQAVLPVLCGSSLKNKGVQPLLNAVGFYLPSPLDVNYGFAEYYGSDLCALAFKLQFDKQRGPLTFIRIYSGMLKSGSTVFNINRGNSEKTSRILQVYADELQDVREATAGNIVAIAGLKETWSGDTITSSQNSAKQAAERYKVGMKEHGGVTERHGVTGTSAGEQLGGDDLFEEEEDSSTTDHLTSDLVPVLAGLTVPDPVFFCSVEAYSQMTQKSLDAALQNLQKEDPSLKVEVNTETGQTVLSGMGELHLDIVRSRLQKEYKLDVELGPLEIAYRETIEETADATEVIDQTLGGKRQFARVRLSVHPDRDQREFRHVVLEGKDQDNPLDLRRWVLKAIENGVKSALSHGSLLNFPVIHTEVRLHEFEKKFTTSIPMITAAASMATTKALREAQCVLLEPMMSMEITTDDDNSDCVLSDLGRRRSHILDIASRCDARVITAVTPLQELVGYSTDLRTMTSGTATASIHLAHYEKMNDNEMQKVIDRLSGFYS